MLGKIALREILVGKTGLSECRLLSSFVPLPLFKIRTFLDYRVLEQMVLSTSVAVH
jgi:hypothetical protein